VVTCFGKLWTEILMIPLWL